MSLNKSPLKPRSMPKGMSQRPRGEPGINDAGGLVAKVLAGATLMQCLGGIALLFVAFFLELPFLYVLGISLALFGMFGLMQLYSPVWPGPARANFAILMLPTLTVAAWVILNRLADSYWTVGVIGTVIQLALMAGFWFMWRPE